MKEQPAAILGRGHVLASPTLSPWTSLLVLFGIVALYLEAEGPAPPRPRTPHRILSRFTCWNLVLSFGTVT